MKFMHEINKTAFGEFLAERRKLFLEILSLIFGVYFWLFMKERIPAYYDENRVSIYNDEMFQINVLGVTFNNSNWPHIVRIPYGGSFLVNTKVMGTSCRYS